ncbi:MAG: UDP-3-O-acyl-N-acetylglucosamine deacetylase [Candidatus Obscuribacterales bacterium]|nr:UDP-3-O-acyl-N-acetylglucosamine deacetylase [Candidatus Obscuribacterales bacterium]
MNNLANNLVYEGKGITSQKPVKLKISKQKAGHGIVFRLRDINADKDDVTVDIPALASSVVNTLRNVTLGRGSTRLCIVEHFLCATALWGLDDLLVEVDGPEIPLGDGSSKFWIELFQSAGWQRQEIKADLELSQVLVCKKGDRLLLAIPDEANSFDYMIDWNHPMIGKLWQSWSNKEDPNQILDARTFGSMQEHQLLGLVDQVVSMTPTGFSEELRFKDEPVRHKILDLVGDLALAGVNPQRWKARFISIKGGHELDVEMAKKLAEVNA